MAANRSLLAYADVATALDRALEAEKGIRVTMMSIGAAVQFRSRCYSYRSALRKQSESLWPPGHPEHGSSPYEDLEIIRDGPMLVIRKYSEKELKIEELT